MGIEDALGGDCLEGKKRLVDLGKITENAKPNAVLPKLAITPPGEVTIVDLGATGAAQDSFKDAVRAAIAATQAGDAAALEKVFGPHGRDLNKQQGGEQLT